MSLIWYKQDGAWSNTVEYSNPNLFINGLFQIWQRGDTILQTNGETYTADRWRIDASNNKSIVERDPGGAGLVFKPLDLSFGSIGQYIETAKELRSLLVGRVITVTIRAKASRTVGGFLMTVGQQSYTYQLSTEYQTISYSFKIQSSYFHEDSLLIKIMDATNKFQISDVIYFAWAKAELSPIFTPLYPKLYHEELLSCKRYYQFIDITERAPYYDSRYFTGEPFPVEMRKTPTIVSKHFYHISNDITDTIQTVMVNRFEVATILSKTPYFVINGNICLDSEIYQ